MRESAKIQPFDPLNLGSCHPKESQSKGRGMRISNIFEHVREEEEDEDVEDMKHNVIVSN